MSWVHIARAAVLQIDHHIVRVSASTITCNELVITHLNSLKKDLEDVIDRAEGIVVPTIQNLSELHRLLRKKQATLSEREVIPREIRIEGDKVYTIALEQVREKLINTHA